MKNPQIHSKPEDLRQQAEEAFQKIALASPAMLEPQTPEAIRSILHELRVHQIQLAMQNEELRRIQEELTATQERFFDLYELAPVGYMTVNEADLIQQINLSAATLLDIPRKTRIHRPITRFIFREDQDIFHLARKKLLETGKMQTCELRMTREDGTPVWVLVTLTTARDSTGTPELRLALNDITERKRSEEALRESSEQFRVVQELLPDGFTILRPVRDAKGRVVDFTWIYQNPVVARLNGTDPQAVVGQRLLEIFPGHRGTQFLNAYQRVAETGEGCIFEDCYQGETITNPIWFRIAVVPTGNDIAILAQNITERKRAEDKARQSHELLTNLAQMMPGVVYQYQLFPDGRSAFPYSSPGMIDIYEVTPAEVRDDAAPVFGRLHPEDYDHVAALIQESARTLRTFYCEFRVILPRQGLRWRWSQAQPERMEDGGTLWHGIISDITERKQAEALLHRTDRALRMISECNQVVIRANSESDLLQAVCDIVVNHGGYRMAWVGLAESDEAQSVRPVAQAGFETGYLNTVNITWADTERGRGPSGTAIRTKQPFVSHDISTEPAFGPWREAAIHRGYASSATVPLMSGERAFAALTVYAAESNAFNAEEVELLAELAENLAYGITALRTVAEHARAEAAMIASEMRYRRLFESSKDGILILDTETGMVVDVNPFLIDLLGYSHEIFLGKKIWELEFIRNHIANETDFLELQTKEYIRYEDMALETRDGRRIEVEFVSNVYLVDSQKVIQCNIRDISERKLAETEIQRFSERLQIATRAARVGIWDWDIVNNVLIWDSMICEIYGIPHGGFTGGIMEWSEYLHPDDRSRVGDDLQAAQRGEYEYAPEFRIIWPDGSIRNIKANSQILFDENGKPLRMVGSNIDITERRRSEEKLAASEKRHRAIIDGSPVPLAVNDGQQRITYLNRAFVSVFGYTQEDIPTLADWWTKAYPDPQYREIVTDSWNTRLEKAKRIGNPFEPQEADIRCKDGTIKTIMASVAPLSEGHYEGEHLAVLFDITERKQVEESHARLALAVEQAAETIVITDTHGTILYANPAFEKTTGYTCAEAIGQNPRVLKSGRQDAAFYGQMWDTIRRGEVWNGRFFNKRKDGILYEEEATISPIRDTVGNVINFVAVKRDVTYEVQLEGQLRQSQKMEAIGRMAGGIAHDFNNILSVIFGYSNLLQIELGENPEALAMIAEILKSGHRAKDLVQQILTFSRQREQERQVIHLHPILEETMILLRASLPKNIQIEMNVAADAPAVLANATQIYQVVMNLGTNAIHAMEGMPTGRLTITLNAFRPDAEHINHHPGLRPIKYARLTVSDTGCGMDAKTLERIYDPFFTTKPVCKGTGLGLAVVHGIVEANDGVITVESLPGHSTTFRVYFPEQVQDISQQGLPEDLVSRGEGQNILMVDDEVALVGMYQQLLKTLNYEGTVVTSPKEAVRLVQENPARFDVLVTDLNMPGMNGLEVASQIREIRADLPIILATGFHGTVTDQQLHDAGICEVVEKPISMTALAMVLRSWHGEK